MENLMFVRDIDTWYSFKSKAAQPSLIEFLLGTKKLILAKEAKVLK